MVLEVMELSQACGGISCSLKFLDMRCGLSRTEQAFGSNTIPLEMKDKA